MGSEVTTFSTSVADEVRAYVVEAMADLRSPMPVGPPSLDADSLADKIFAFVTGREFYYLSRTKTARYRDQTVSMMQRRIARAEPFRFFYDIGPGYHASLRPGEA